MVSVKSNSSSTLCVCSQAWVRAQWRAPVEFLDHAKICQIFGTNASMIRQIFGTKPSMIYQIFGIKEFLAMGYEDSFLYVSKNKRRRVQIHGTLKFSGFAGTPRARYCYFWRRCFVSSRTLHSSTCILRFVAPEVCRKMGDYAEKTDIFPEEFLSHS